MIEPEAATKWRNEARFDRTATVLVGLIAVLAAVLAILQTNYGNSSTRSQLLAARLAADVSVRISTSSLARDSELRGLQDALTMGMSGLSRMLASGQVGDPGPFAVGMAQQAAADRLGGVLAATAATSGGPPLDAYAADLVTATTSDLDAEVAEQGRLVDAANDAGTRQLRAVLGLSFLALAGVLTGVAAVLRHGRAGWIALLVACGIVGATALLTVATVV